MFHIRSIFPTLLCLILFILPGSGIRAQSIEKTDSVFLEVLKSPDDTVLLLEFQGAINRIAFRYPDTALFYANRMLLYSEDARYDYGIVQALNMQGLSYEMSENFDSARAKYKKAAALAMEYHFSTTLINIYNNLSILESTQGYYEISLEYLLKGLTLAIETGDSARIGTLTNNIGLRYSEMQIQEKALEYYRRAISIYILTDREFKLDNTYSNLGRSYFILQEFDSSTYYYHKSIEIGERNENFMTQINAILGLGMVFWKTGHLDSSAYYQQKGIGLARDHHDEYGIAEALLLDGHIKLLKGEYDGAEKALMEASAIAERNNIKPLQVDIYKALAELYETSGNLRGALRYNALHNTLRDTLYRQEKDKAINVMQLYEEEKAEKEKSLLASQVELEKLRVSRQRNQRNMLIIVGSLLLLLAGGLYHRFLYVRRTKNQLAQQNTIIQQEKDRSDDLLLNILPLETAQELKSKGTADSRHYDLVTVFFSDFVGFTEMAEKMTPAELVSQIDHYFRQFDMIITKYGIEKIKTIGDAYMCAGGLPVPNNSHATDVLKAAIEIRKFIVEEAKIRLAKGLPAFNIRIGIHTGPVVAGIVGIKKFAYDIWGDTVNIASRMESSGEPGMINISRSTYELVKDRFKCTHRGKIEAKGKGEIDMYFVE